MGNSNSPLWIYISIKSEIRTMSSSTFPQCFWRRWISVIRHQLLEDGLSKPSFELTGLTAGYHPDLQHAKVFSLMDLLIAWRQYRACGRIIQCRCVHLPSPELDTWHVSSRRDVTPSMNSQQPAQTLFHAVDPSWLKPNYKFSRAPRRSTKDSVLATWDRLWREYALDPSIQAVSVYFRGYYGKKLHGAGSRQ